MARKMISLTERTYKELAQLGNLEDSFDSVIHRMIEEREREKVATSGLSLAGRSQIAATAPLKPEGDNG
jgi:predicted CopG family antitoxin